MFSHYHHALARGRKRGSCATMMIDLVCCSFCIWSVMSIVIISPDRSREKGSSLHDSNAHFFLPTNDKRQHVRNFLCFFMMHYNCQRNVNASIMPSLKTVKLISFLSFLVLTDSRQSLSSRASALSLSMKINNLTIV
jgi:hypothetical protein